MIVPEPVWIESDERFLLTDLLIIMTIMMMALPAVTLMGFMINMAVLSSAYYTKKSERKLPLFNRFYYLIKISVLSNP